MMYSPLSNKLVINIPPQGGALNLIYTLTKDSFVFYRHSDGESTNSQIRSAGGDIRIMSQIGSINSMSMGIAGEAVYAKTTLGGTLYIFELN